MTKQERTERGATYRGKLNDAIHRHAARAVSAGPGSAAEGAQEDLNRRVACSTLSHLLMRDDGWLRVVPAANGKSVFIKWKFSRGDFRGRYVMAVVEVWQWDYGLTLLADKLEAVDAGVKIPTQDSPYDGYNDGDIVQ